METKLDNLDRQEYGNAEARSALWSRQIDEGRSVSLRKELFRDLLGELKTYGQYQPLVQVRSIS